MSNIKFNLQMFAGGADWSEGITESAIRSAYDTFSTDIDNAIDAIKNYASVDEALREGWSGQDCEKYLTKFHDHAAKIVTQIDDYRTAVKGQVDSIIEQWDEFQAGLIS